LIWLGGTLNQAVINSCAIHSLIRVVTVPMFLSTVISPRAVGRFHG
jgi:hypothetical protein